MFILAKCSQILTPNIAAEFDVRHLDSMGVRHTVQMFIPLEVEIQTNQPKDEEEKITKNEERCYKSIMAAL